MLSLGGGGRGRVTLLPLGGGGGRDGAMLSLGGGGGGRVRLAALAHQTQLSEGVQGADSNKSVLGKSDKSTEQVLPAGFPSVRSFDVNTGPSNKGRTMLNKRERLHAHYGERDLAPVEELKNELYIALEYRLRRKANWGQRPEFKERQDWEENEERKLFRPLNPLPLQVLALRSAGGACLRAERDISEFVPKIVLYNTKVLAVIVSREQPRYPVRGVFKYFILMYVGI